MTPPRGSPGAPVAEGFVRDDRPRDPPLSRRPCAARPMKVQFFVSPPSVVRGGVALAMAVLALLAGCDPSPEPSTGGAGGGGGSDAAGGMAGAGGCLQEPLPTFALSVLAQAGGPLPPDTTVEIRWSAGDEAPFHLDDPTSWPTLDSASFQCDVDPAAPPLDLEVLSCALWTASPTEVTVSAGGYVTEKHTYMAEPSSDCNPRPTPIEIELMAMIR